MKNKGFSLVELIVVIAIMAILVGVAVPVYTGYISKANEAKDIQLLEEINSAFMTVAIEKETTDFTFKDYAETDRPFIEVLADGTVDLANMTPASFRAGMLEILGDDLKFNVITEIFYNQVTHKFETGGSYMVEYGDGYIVLDKEDIANLKNSTFGTEMTVQELLGKVQKVTGYASALDIGALKAYDEVLGSTGFAMSAIDALDLDVTGKDPAVVLQAEVARLAEEMRKVNPSLTLEQAAAQVQANAAVLYAAQSAVELDPAELTTLLTGNNIVGDIAANVYGSGVEADEGKGLAQAAVAYGMYVAYVEKYGTADDIAAAEQDPKNAIIGLESNEAFKNYVNTAEGQADLQGFLSSMQMINSSTGSKEAVEKLMINGFADPDLVDIIDSAVNE